MLLPSFFSQTICIGNIELRGSCLQLQLLVFLPIFFIMGFYLTGQTDILLLYSKHHGGINNQIKKGGILCIEENSIQNYGRKFLKTM